MSEVRPVLTVTSCLHKMDITFQHQKETTGWCYENVRPRQKTRLSGYFRSHAPWLWMVFSGGVSPFQVRPEVRGHGVPTRSPCLLLHLACLDEMKPTRETFRCKKLQTKGNGLCSVMHYGNRLPGCCTPLHLPTRPGKCVPGPQASDAGRLLRTPVPLRPRRYCPRCPRSERPSGTGRCTEQLRLGAHHHRRRSSTGRPVTAHRAVPETGRPIQHVPSCEVCLKSLKMYWSSLSDRAVTAQGAPSDHPIGGGVSVPSGR